MKWIYIPATLWIFPAAAVAQRHAPPQDVVVDTTPSHAVSSFSPFRSLGAGIDRLRGGITDKVMTPEFIEKIQSAGWQTVSYRQNTELFAEAWHWNPKGTWSNAAAKQVYFIGDATPTEMIRHSWAAPLPHRGGLLGPHPTRPNTAYSTGRVLAILSDVQQAESGKRSR
ncbi:MAG: hypothetical protein ACJ74Z_12505 [Bryobacteraceae bacterium]